MISKCQGGQHIWKLLEQVNNYYTTHFFPYNFFPYYLLYTLPTKVVMDSLVNFMLLWLQLYLHNRAQKLTLPCQ